jgi:hypothetical protein
MIGPRTADDRKALNDAFAGLLDSDKSRSIVARASSGSALKVFPALRARQFLKTERPGLARPHIGSGDIQPLGPPHPSSQSPWAAFNQNSEFVNARKLDRAAGKLLAPRLRYSVTKLT